jgi:hypothetical protein
MKQNFFLENSAQINSKIEQNISKDLLQENRSPFNQINSNGMKSGTTKNYGEKRMKTFFPLLHNLT